MDLARRNNIIVVDDSATFIKTYKGRSTGTIADITVFFLKQKNILLLEVKVE